MKLKITTFLFLLLGIGNALLAQINQDACIQDATILGPGGQTALYFCNGDGDPDRIRFRVTPFAQPFAYLVTDDKNTILLVSRSNIIDFDTLPAGNLRVWAFAFKGNILAQPGQDATSAVLADYCYALTQNFIPIGSVVPEGGTVATQDGRSSLFTCAGDGNADIIQFTTTSNDPLFKYVITDANNVILAIADSNRFDFESLRAERVRVWGVSYVGNILAKTGDTLTIVDFASGCFDLSNNFIEVLRSKPAGGNVSLSNGETSKTLCAEDLQNDILSFVARNNAPTPYAFLVTNDNGVVLEILSGNTANLSVSAPGICRVYGVSYTGRLTVRVGDNINSAVLSDDCFDVSSNFVRIIKREVDGGTVRLSSGGTSGIVCVVEGASQAVTFANTSTTASSNYTYFVTNESNIILAIVNGNAFNFAGLNARTVRVWGLSYSGTLLARVGDNAATAALSNECYDLSDNFITITRQAVDGAAVSLESGATSATACTGDGRADVFAFRNTSTSVESYIYIITNNSGTVLGFINGHQFDFNTLTVDTARVYGLAYSGEFRVRVGDNINTGNLASNCFDLSNNFVTIFRTFVDGGTVSLSNGADSAQVCLGSVAASTLTFTNTSTAAVSYGYLITNAANVIQAVTTDSVFNFSSLSGSVFRVWGFSYSGTVTANVGSNAAQVALSNGCYELSSNFILVTTDVAEGGTVSLVGGGTTANSCLNDTTAGQFRFANTSTSENDTYYYVVTGGTGGTVIAIDTNNTLNFRTLPIGTYRVYGLSITGVLQLTVGGNISGSNLSSECFDLSDNFVTIVQANPDGGTVRLTNDSTTATRCSNDPSAVLRFENTSAATETYAYVLTDTNNVITAILPSDSFNFAGTSNATFRVYGVSYSGSVTARVGNNLTQVAFSNGCFERSANFITLQRQAVDGGRVRLQNGDTATVACLGVAQVGELVFVNNSNVGANYTYLIVDSLNIIRGLATNNRFNFNTLPIGTYRVRGLSYTGNLQAAVGINVGELLSNGCFDLSDNAVVVTQKNVDGGRIALSNGDTSTFVCGSTATPGTLVFNFTNNANASYAFLVTDRNNRIIVVLNGNSISFNGAAIGEYRVWGLSYTGTLQARVGNGLDSLALSTECFDLSNNFVSIRREATEGGNIATTDGRSAYTFCPDNGRADVLSFQTTGNSSGSYIYILTDTSNRFITRLTNGSINFDTLPEGSYRVRGLAFTGNLTLQPGTAVTQGALSNGCFALSNNFISVTNQIPNGGTVSLIENQTQTFTCPADGDADVVRFFRQGVIGSNFVFLVTDTNNIIEAIVRADSFDFERPTEGISRVWGLAYSGNLTARVGDNAATANLSDDCFDLSNNFIQVIREIPNGGLVSLENGDSTVFACVNGGSQVVRFDSTGTSRGEYIYVITDANNVIRNGIAGDQFDFSFLSPPGEYRVWGLAYTGMLIATIGDTVTNVAISDDCYTLSENFVRVIISNTDGGAVTVNGSANPIQICGGDGIPDTIRLANTSPASSARYTYLITNDSNRVLQVLTGTIFDFTGVSADTVRIWGLSYSGNLLVQVGDNAATDTLASGCFDLSNNFVRAIRSNVDGATIGSSRNTSIIYTCANDRVADTITFSNNSSARAQYRYVITNENNIIRGVINGSTFDFETAGRGVSRIWGVSYTGTFTGAFGANITTAALSNGCFNLSDNFITVARDTVFGGEITTNNFTDPFCASPSIPGVVMITTSELFTGYQYVITDTTNTVLKIQQSDTIRFDSLPVGNYRVWGLSYAGDLLVRPGDNLLGVDLASSCFEISASFVPVYRSTVIDGGRVFNVAGTDTLTVCATDTLPDIVVLENNSDAKDADYQYVLTDQNNRIILRVGNEIIDFNRAARGIYRIYGVSYTGTLATLGNDNITTAILTDSCYQISENFITVNVETPNPGRVLTADTLSALDLTVGDDSSDVVSFIAIGAAGGTVDYLVLDSANVVVAIITNDSIDFETFDPGTYRVRSVAYAGNLTVAVGDTATNIALSDDCYALSTSSVRITLTNDGNLQDPTQRRRAAANLAVSPNPVTHQLRLQFNWSDTAEPTSNLAIFNLIGQKMLESRIPATDGDNQYMLDVQTLPDGLYILQLRNGDEVQSIRFLKQWQ